MQGAVPTLVLTGQHALDPSDFDLGGFPRISLHCAGVEDPHRHVAAVSRAMEKLLAAPPDMILVQGDTSSALGGALAGFAAGVPVGHVEAGLRTHDPKLPWPEEEYRTAIDAYADLLFAPTELAAANLAAEKVPGEIHVTGNSGIDALLEVASRVPAAAFPESTGRKILVTCHRRESWQDGLDSIAAALVELAEDDVDMEFVLHPNAFVAERMRSLLAGVDRIRLLPPCDHAGLIRRMRAADLVLSDSGGVQEEAPALGVPLLVLREKTERPEGIASGSSRLVGTDRGRIVAEVRQLLADPGALAAMSRSTLPFGDGRTGPRIASIVISWLQPNSADARMGLGYGRTC